LVLRVNTEVLDHTEFLLFDGFDLEAVVFQLLAHLLALLEVVKTLLLGDGGVL
jgi:hypothetical protein